MDIPGRFLARRLSPGLWLLTRTQPPALEVRTQGVEFDEAQAVSLANCSALNLEWQDSGVLLRLGQATHSGDIRARSAMIHEPQPRLYESLPLANFDAGARRFWRWVFRIVRIPGGRHLLRVMARRSRSNG
jgi:hypothetical protein